MAASMSKDFRAVGLVWLGLDDLVDFLKEVIVVGVDGIELLPEMLMNFIGGGFAASES